MTETRHDGDAVDAPGRDGAVSAVDNRNRTAEFIANPRRAVWKLSLPVMAGMGIQMLYNLTDMAFVGRLGGDAVAALTFNLPLAFFFIGIAFGLGTGATSLIARHIGGDDKTAADKALTVANAEVAKAKTASDTAEAAAKVAEAAAAEQARVEAAGA